MNEILQRFGSGRVIAMTGIGIGLMAFFGYIMVRANQPEMALLYNQIEAAEGGRVLEKLKSMGVPFEVKGDGTQIYAPVNDISRLRMELAQNGMPSGGGVGYEIFDKQDILGTTNALLGINQIRALEGELAKSIQTIQGIHSARVHLVIPKRELFSENKQEPSASVMVRMRGLAVLSATQVQSIRYLVSSAVPSLILDHVSIIDDRGNLLARGKDSAETKDTFSAQRTTQHEYEQRLARAIETLLDKTLGINKTRAEVCVEMVFDQVSSTSVQFDPDGQVVKSQTTNEEGANSTEKSASDTVSIQNSLPTNDSQNNGAGHHNQNQTSNTEENINYEISNTTKTYIKELGTIKRLSIAVIVDGNYKKKNDGTQEYQPLPEDELKKLKELIKTASGYKENRGDVISLVNLPFNDNSQDNLLENEKTLPSDLNLNRLMELSITALVILICLFTVFKPLVSSLIKVIPLKTVIDKGVTSIISDNSKITQASEQNTATHQDHLSSSTTTLENASTIPTPINMEPTKEKLKNPSSKKIAELVDQHPEEAVSILRTWMSADK